MKNIQQRFDTILRVSQAIVERQKNFFTHGEIAMRPLVLREIADELGLHESTISRVTTAKYMATPFGTFELKYFFGSSLGTETGGNASSTAVRALIKQLVAAEDAAKPLSDSQISQMLKEQGIQVRAPHRRQVPRGAEASRRPTCARRCERAPCTLVQLPRAAPPASRTPRCSCLRRRHEACSPRRCTGCWPARDLLTCSAAASRCAPTGATRCG